MTHKRNFRLELVYFYCNGNYHFQILVWMDGVGFDKYVQADLYFCPLYGQVNMVNSEYSVT